MAKPIRKPKLLKKRPTSLISSLTKRFSAVRQQLSFAHSPAERRRLTKNLAEVRARLKEAKQRKGKAA